MSESGTTFVTLAEAARLLDTTEIRVLTMLEKNELQGKMVAVAWYVDRSSINLHEKPKAAGIVSAGGCGICGSRCGNGC